MGYYTDVSFIIRERDYDKFLELYQELGGIAFPEEWPVTEKTCKTICRRGQNFKWFIWEDVRRFATGIWTRHLEDIMEEMEELELPYGFAYIGESLDDILEDYRVYHEGTEDEAWVPYLEIMRTFYVD